MKKIIKTILVLLTITSICLSFSSCKKAKSEKDPWEDAVYTTDTEFGSGEKTITARVRVGEKSVTFTINTDKDTLGDALTEHKLVSGEEGEYGMYVKVVNGIEADYDKTQSYWGFNKNGESMMTGIDMEEISDGDSYEIVYTD